MSNDENVQPSDVSTLSHFVCCLNKNRQNHTEKKQKKEKKREKTKKKQKKKKQKKNAVFFLLFFSPKRKKQPSTNLEKSGEKMGKNQTFFVFFPVFFTLFCNQRWVCSLCKGCLFVCECSFCFESRMKVFFFSFLLFFLFAKNKTIDSDKQTNRFSQRLFCIFYLYLYFYFFIFLFF